MIFKNNKQISPLRKAGFLIAVAILFFSTTSTYAQTAILDNIADGYRSAATGWTGTLLAFANRLFMLLATIELAWSFAVWALDKNEFQSFFAAVAKKIMWIGMFYALLLNGPIWIPAIIDSFVDAGSSAGGTGGLSPSGVFATGLDNAATMLAGIQDLSLWDDFAAIVIAGLAGIVIVIAFAVIAGQLLVALVESYIVVSAGLLFLGFGGSRWTTDFVQKFIGYAVATGVKLFMLYLIVGIGNAQAQSWKALLTTINTPGAAVFNIILSVLGGSILLALLAIQIPAMAASMLAGSPTLTAGAAATTAGAVGAGIVGAGAAGAASTLSAAKSAGGLASATKAAWGEAGAQGTTGLARAVSTLGNMGTSAARDTSNRIADSIAPTKGGRMADISTARTNEMQAANSAFMSPTPSSNNNQPPAPPAPNGGNSQSTSQTGNSGQQNQTTGTGQSQPFKPAGATVASNQTSNTPKNGDFASALDPSTTRLGSENNQPAPPGVQEKIKPSSVKAPGVEDRMRELQQVRPPNIPSDAAAPATVSIKIDNPQD